MKPQTLNSIRLYKGGNPASIEMLLSLQSVDVVNELKAYYGTNNLHELAVKCSIGK